MSSARVREDVKTPTVIAGTADARDEPKENTSGFPRWRCDRARPWLTGDSPEAPARSMTFTGTREEVRERLDQLDASGATGIIFGTSGYDVERELRAYAEIAGLR